MHVISEVQQLYVPLTNYNNQSHWATMTDKPLQLEHPPPQAFFLPSLQPASQYSKPLLGGLGTVCDHEDRLLNQSKYDSVILNCSVLLNAGSSAMYWGKKTFNNSW